FPTGMVVRMTTPALFMRGYAYSFITRFYLSTYLSKRADEKVPSHQGFHFVQDYRLKVLVVKRLSFHH
ncbi:MAG: hypothetical protein AAF135_24765, partial [Bacteroidota bacterium]